MQDKPKSKFTKTTIILMVGTAIFFDVLSIIPVVNWFSLFFGYMTFGVWFMILGVPLFGLRKIVTYIISLIIEAIPAISAFPSITLAILVIIGMEKAEEVTGIDVKGLVKPGVKNVARNKDVLENASPNVVTLSRKKALANNRLETRELKEAA